MNQDLSAGQLTFMAVLVATVLAVWLIAVFLAAREPRDASASAGAQPRDDPAAPARPAASAAPGAKPSDKAAA